MTVLLIILLVLCFILAIIGAFGPIIPSVLFTWLGALCIYFMPTSTLSDVELLIISVICVVAYCIDYVIPTFSTKFSGGTKAGVRGATIGLIISCITPFTPISLLFGGPWAIVILPFIGAYIGELTVNKDNHLRAFRSAIGSFVGFLFSVGLKIALAIGLIWLLFAKVSF